MTSSRVVALFSGFLIVGFPWTSQTFSDFDFHNALQSTEGNKNLRKRSILTFAPESVLQINMGITLAGQFERNSAVIVLALQQNGPLPVDSQPFLLPSVVTARKFSVYDHLRDVIASYGFNGSECLRKMVCQIGEAPLLGGLLEDVISFVLSPSKHRGLLFGDAGLQRKERKYVDLLLESEKLGKLGGNCSSAFPQCVKTPLDLISSLIHL